ncbi:MAG: M23 family metallopeptidase [Clostridia bacterium]|nr:M23 family metallopeptidase [Clostridia bacterium]
MSMKKRRTAAQRIREWMMEYAYLVTIGAAAAVVAAGAIYTGQIREESGMQAAAEAPEIRASAPPATLPAEQVTPLPTIAPLRVRYDALEKRVGTVWPVGGAVVRAYDIRQPVLWAALDCVKIHEGIDIAGEAGESVRCAADGVVTAMMRDELWGWRIRVAHMDGSEAVYAGLESCDVIQEQTVTRGQQLGVLLERIPCEDELGTHLHMEFWRDGECCSPEAILPQKDTDM